MSQTYHYIPLRPSRRVFVTNRQIGGWLGEAVHQVLCNGQLHGYVVAFEGGAQITCAAHAVSPARDLVQLFGLDPLPAAGTLEP